MRRQRIFTED